MCLEPSPRPSPFRLSLSAGLGDVECGAGVCLETEGFEGVGGGGVEASPRPSPLRPSLSAGTLGAVDIECGECVACEECDVEFCAGSARAEGFIGTGCGGVEE